MTRRLLDLFCGAGGAAMGYHRAGFDEIVGVDLHPQPRYPFEFVQADALEFAKQHAHKFDAVHASPPCQRWSAGAAKWGTRHQHPDLIGTTQRIIESSGLPYVIENIPPARGELRDPIMLCGTMFDLGVFRHRLFETSWPVNAPDHEQHRGRIGDGRYVTVAGNPGGSSNRDGWRNGGTDDWRRAMGIDWMIGRELNEAIPPAFTEHVGRSLLSLMT